ncbi:MAG: GxxExxY protein [Bacteroidales bacterium]|nr:GxxExxY protein [Bacteroidales bacterium]
MEKEDFLYADETYKIIGAAMEVHRHLGPGFLESVYQEAMEMELAIQGIPFRSQQKIQVQYKGKNLQHFYIADFICYDKIVVELKAVSDILPIHSAQVLNYLVATGLKVGLLLNFNEESLYQKRIINSFKHQYNTNRNNQ